LPFLPFGSDRPPLVRPMDWLYAPLGNDVEKRTKKAA
jgi:hypothetical protein